MGMPNRRTALFGLLGFGAAALGGHAFYGIDLDDLEEDTAWENTQQKSLEDIREERDEDTNKRIADLMETYEIPSAAKAKELDDAVRFETAIYAGIGGPTPFLVSDVLDSIGFSGYKKFSSKVTASGLVAAFSTVPIEKVEGMLRPTKISPHTLQNHYGLTRINADLFYDSHKHHLGISAGLGATAIAVLSSDY